MRLLFVIGNLGGGGAERVLAILSGALANKGADVKMCLIDRAGIPSAYIVSDKVSVTDFFSVRPWLGRMRALRKTIKEYKPDAVIGFMTYNAIQASVAAWGLGIPVIYRMATDPFFEMNNFYIRWGVRLFFSRAGGAVYQNQTQKSFFRPSKHRKETVILNPVAEDNLWDAEKYYLKTEIAAVGRLNEGKNFSLLLKAFSVAADNCPEWRLIIYGDGELRGRLAREILDLNLSEKVTLAGFVPDIPKRLHSASVFAMTSNFEGMPNALMEAMCMGCACVTTDFDGGGARLLIENGVNGIIVPKNDAENLIVALSRVMESCNVRKNIGEEAIKLRKAASAEEIAGQWLKFLDSVIGNRP